jgi:spoIIIJ-associated protein
MAGQFNAHDRRIIHITLKEDREVRTHSVGEGYYRKLKIYPKRKRKKNAS